MAAVDALHTRQFGDRRQVRSISPDDVNDESDRRMSQRRALLEKPGEIVHPPARPALPR